MMTANQLPANQSLVTLSGVLDATLAGILVLIIAVIFEKSRRAIFRQRIARRSMELQFSEVLENADAGIIEEFEIILHLANKTPNPMLVEFDFQRVLHRSGLKRKNEHLPIDHGRPVNVAGHSRLRIRVFPNVLRSEYSEPMFCRVIASTQGMIPVRLPSRDIATINRRLARWYEKRKNIDEFIRSRSGEQVDGPFAHIARFMLRTTMHPSAVHVRIAIKDGHDPAKLLTAEELGEFRRKWSRTPIAHRQQVQVGIEQALGTAELQRFTELMTPECLQVTQGGK